MVSYKTLLLIITYAVFYCAAGDKPKPIVPDPQEWITPKVNLGNTLVTLVNKWLVNKENGVKKILETQLKEYKLITEIDLLVREVFDISSTNPELTALNVALSELGVLFGKIDDVYKTYLFYQDTGKNASDPMLRFWLDHTRSPYTGPLDYLNEIFTRTVPRRIDVSTIGVGFQSDGTVLSRLTKYIKDYKLLCNKSKSQQQILHILYNTIMFATFKVHDVLDFCYRELAKVGATDYDSEIKLLLIHAHKNIDSTATMFEHFMHESSREVWRCDPKVHVENETYVQLYNVFQKFIVHDNDVNNEHNCLKHCDSIQHGEVTNCDKTDRIGHYDIDTKQDEQSICDQQRACDGYFYDCEDYFVDYNELWICPSALDSTRRYEFMMHGRSNVWSGRTDESRHYGRKGKKTDCSRPMTYDYRSWGKSFADAYRDCEICLCTCVDWRNPTSDKYVNIRPAVADKDYVVTGARLVKENHTLHIQIEQGIILKSGEIDSFTIHWKPIAPVRSPLDLHLFNQQCKDIYLGVTDVPKGKVIVGLKLSKFWYTDGYQMIGLRTLSAFYDYNTGTMQRLNVEQELEETDFDGPQSPINISDSVRVDLKNADVPTKNEFENQPQPDSMLIVNVTTSDFKKDLGQTLIPFFDIQEVKVRPAAPLSGIGFYHKGRKGYGGFVGIKLLTYDHSDYLN